MIFLSDLLCSGLIIGHLKSDHRMVRNYLKGFRGDEVNLLLAASAFNLKKWMRLYFFALYTGNSRLVLAVVNVMECEVLRLEEYKDIA